VRLRYKASYRVVLNGRIGEEDPKLVGRSDWFDPDDPRTRGLAVDLNGINMNYLNSARYLADQTLVLLGFSRNAYTLVIEIEREEN
jgi:hypothetical protein